jgi:hypothetical protein
VRDVERDAVTPTAAIVTTLRLTDPAFQPVLRSFLTYHLAAGFAHLYLFFDDPGDPAIAVAQRYPEVTCIPYDETLQRQWQETAVYRTQPQLREYVDREVRARQSLNAAVAIELARRDGIDWLFHIDLDELIYLPEQSLGDQLRWLSDSGVRRVTCLNHEAVPEEFDITDYFAEVTLFRRNVLTLPGRRLNPAQQAAVAQTPQLAPGFFHFYGNGKSGVRLGEGVWPGDVHSFSLPEERTFAVRLHRRLARSRAVQQVEGRAGPFGRWLHSYLRRHSSPVKAILSPNVYVLHYACCGFAHFWNKYEMRGAFADRWFGRSDIAARIGTFHLEARDVVLAGDVQKARVFYEQRLQLNESARIGQLLELGLLARIPEPAALLGSTGETGGPG